MAGVLTGRWHGWTERLLVLLAVFCLPHGALAKNVQPPAAPPTKQELVSANGFTETVIEAPGRRVHFYHHGDLGGRVRNLIVYLQGSDPSPAFFWRAREGRVQLLSWLPGDHRRIGQRDVYAVIEKPGFEGVFGETIDAVPATYQSFNSLDDRVMRASAVISHLTASADFERVIVYGHSEGAPVAARLATQNSAITHLGFWAGNALPDFFDFALAERLRVHRGESSTIEAQASVDEMLGYFANEIMAHPQKTTKDPLGYSNKRWASYAKPPYLDLIALDIPVFVQVASDDKSAPIESSYIIPLEFARLGKTNLDYRVCTKCDHGFAVTEDGVRARKWPEIFSQFLDWAMKD